MTARWLLVCAALLLAACEDPDRALLDGMIRDAVASGAITRGTHYRDANQELRVVRVVVSSVLPHEARRAADAVCERARRLPLRVPVRVEAHLLVGNNARPAGACYSRLP